MNRERFFDALAEAPFGAPLSPCARRHIGVILDYWQRHHAAAPLAQLAYVLATVLAEVGKDMAPVRETFARDDAQARARLAERAYGQPCGPCGEVYYGRGYVQLTWERNYARMARKLDLPLVESPDLALDPEVALRILVTGMLEGDFDEEGHGLPHYINEERVDFVAARNTVNLQNRAGAIARDAEAFLSALRLAGR